MKIDYDGESSEEAEINHVETENVDVWDDTELIVAWDETIQEYRKHAKDRGNLKEAAGYPSKWTIIGKENADLQAKKASALTDGIIKILDDKKVETKKRKAVDEVVKKTDESPETMVNKKTKFPQVPDTLPVEMDTELQEVLWAWYNAGYQTAKYMEKHGCK